MKVPTDFPRDVCSLYIAHIRDIVYGGDSDRRTSMHLTRIDPDETWPDHLMAKVTITIRQGVIDGERSVQQMSISVVEEMAAQYLDLPLEVFQPVQLLNPKDWTRTVRYLYKKLGLPKNTVPPWDTQARRRIHHQADVFIAEIRRIVADAVFTGESPKDLTPLDFNLWELSSIAVTHVCLACKGNPANAAYHLACTLQLLQTQPDMSPGVVHPLLTVQPNELPAEAWTLVEQLRSIAAQRQADT